MPVTRHAGGLLHHLFTLTSSRSRGGLFLWPCPRVAPPGCYPASYPVESGLSSLHAWRNAITQPTQPHYIYIPHSKGYVNAVPITGYRTNYWRFSPFPAQAGERGGVFAPSPRRLAARGGGQGERQNSQHETADKSGRYFSDKNRSLSNNLSYTSDNPMPQPNERMLLKGNYSASSLRAASARQPFVSERRNPVHG